jgi:hypothetical protein
MLMHGTMSALFRILVKFDIKSPLPVILRFICRQAGDWKKVGQEVPLRHSHNLARLNESS